MSFPRFVFLGFVAALLSIVLSGAIAWYVQASRDAETQRDCQRSVSYRADNRAMWVYLIDQANPDRTAEEQERFDAFVAELNRRLPPLECHDGNAVPVD